MMLLVFVILLTSVVSNPSTTTYNCSSEFRCRCIHERSTLRLVADCVELNLTVSPHFYSKVYYVNLSKNMLQKLPSQDKLPYQLEYLDLSHNNISSLLNEDDKFLRLPLLIYLNLSSNRIETNMTNYHDNAFKNFSNLRELDVSDNTNYYANISEYQVLDAVWEPLVSLEKLSIDAIQNVTFGKGIAKLTNLTSLTLAGQCSWARLVTIGKDYFKHFPYLVRLDLSSNVFYDAVKHYWDHNHYCCSLQRIDSGAISTLRYLEVLDVSYNRLLGLCGLRNITYDLPFTEIKVLKANFLHCESGISLTLYCDDVQPFQNTSLRELHLDGNHLSFGQMDLLRCFPESLERLSLKSNRWVVDEYTHVLLEYLYGLKFVDISNQNDHQMSRSSDIYEYCHTFLASTNCQKFRGKALGNSQSLVENEEFMCSCTKHDSNTTINENAQFERIQERNYLSNTQKPFCSIDFDIYNLNVLYKKVPPNIDTLVLNNSRLGFELPWTMFRNDTMKSLILSHNQFYSILGPICNATNLKHLDLSHNKCSRISTYAFEYLESLETLLLNDNLIGNSDLFESETMTDIFANLTTLESLYLTSNRLQWLPERMFWNLGKLKHLRLDNNRLTDWNFTIKHMSQIGVVNLSMNSILAISKSGMQFIDDCTSANLKIDLTNNPLQCTCSSRPYIEWMTKRPNLFPNFHSYSINCQGKRMDVDNANKYLTKICSSYVSLIVACSCLSMAFVCFVLVAILYRYRFKFRYWYYIKLRISGTDNSDSEQYRYDAFISYADEDRTFVIRSLMDQLEKKNYRLCIHHRDFMPGTSIIENITNAIHCSNKVIFVLTNSFIRSQWCLYEVEAARAESQYSFSRQKNMMLFLLRDKIIVRKIPRSIQNYLDHDTFIEFPQDSDDEQEFWDTLAQAIRD